MDEADSKDLGRLYSLSMEAAIRERFAEEHPEFEGRLFYDIMDVARLCNLSRTTIYSAIADGRLQRVKVGRRALIPTSSVCAFYANLIGQLDED